jgi:preprotein translocase subunit SecG
MHATLVSLHGVLAASVLNDIMVYSFRTLFFLSAILLMVIVLLQEGKGGGLASALGGQGAETFGVSSGGVNKVTLFLAGLFLMAALGHALAFDQTVSKTMRENRKSKANQDSPLRELGPGGKEGTGTGTGTEPGSGGGSTKEPVKEPAKDTPKDAAPKDAAPKDAAPKDAPPKEPVKEAPKDAPK